MLSESPDRLLFADADGNAATLEDVIGGGLDGEYQDRVPALVERMKHGTPFHRLMACVLLTSWGHEPGFNTLVEWASRPGLSPWGQ